MGKTLLCSPKTAHVNHLPGPCRQPEGFNGTVFWDLHMSQVLFERRKVSRGKPRGETFLSVELEGDMACAQRIAASVLVAFPGRHGEMLVRGLSDGG